jgi:hypothetical protein
LPAKSRSLGFPCPSCKSGIGSISVEKQKNWWDKKERKRAKGKTHESYNRKPRALLRPNEYAFDNSLIEWFRKVITTKGTEALEKLQDSPQWNLFTDVEKHKLEDAIMKIKSSEDMKGQQKQTDYDHSKWQVVEKVEDIDPRVFELMRIMSDGIVLERHNANEKWSGNDVIKYNPFKEILDYRQSPDFFRHFDLGSLLDFYVAKLSFKYPSFTMEEVLSPKKCLNIHKAGEIYDRYVKPFSNKRWHYTWVERFWIVAFAKARGIGNTLNMLRALDGDRGRVSNKYLKNLTEPTLKFWEDYYEYMPSLFELLYKGHALIDSDQELKIKYQKMLERHRIEIERYQKETISNYLKQALLQSDYGGNDGYKGNGKEETSKHDDYLRVTRARPDRIRIYHYNPNYKKEMEERKKGIRKEDPWKRKRCGPFRLSQLPPNIIFQLTKEGRLQI